MKIAIKKHNSITDGLTNFSLPAEKLLNALYHTWEEEDYEHKKMTIPIADLKALIGYDSNNDEALFAYLDELTFSQRWRNFEHKGRGVKYHSGPFMSYTMWKDTQNHIDFYIDPIVVSAIKEKAGYTPLELQIVEKFRTKTGYKLYQLWRRYYTLPNHEAPLPLPEDSAYAEKGVFKKGIDELNTYLGMNYSHASQLARTVQRGLDEIEKISGEKILLTVDKRTKDFQFKWIRKADLKIYHDGVYELSPDQLNKMVIAIDTSLIDNDKSDVKSELLRLAKYHGFRVDSDTLQRVKSKLKEYRNNSSLF